MLMLCEHAAAFAVPYSSNRLGECRGQLAGAVAITLEQVKRNALRGLLPDPGHAAQAVDQANK